MFDGGVVNEVDSETIASYEADWRSVHQTLCELVRTRVALEAEEGTYLLEAEELRVFKRLGYRSMVEYMVGELGYTRHAANERLRVARELVALPQLAAAFRDGELCFSKVRELTRVVTPATEAAFIDEATGKDSHQVARMVSGLRRGDRPDAEPDPALVTTRVVYELHAEAMSLLACRTKELAVELGRAPTSDELVIALCTAGSARNSNAVGPTGDVSTGKAASSVGPTGDDSTDADAVGPTGDRVPPPGARQLFVTCKHCDRSELIVDGQGLAIDRATAERLACDVELVGDADTDERTRVTSAIPAAIRRKVFMRDKLRCVAPGCTARKHLDIHHLRHREHGGTHTMKNCAVLCFHHHKAHHDGVLEIAGTAPHRLVFQWKLDEDPEIHRELVG